MKDLTGARLGNYDVMERLGAGGMAVVYRAVQQPLGREVALKALMPNLIEDRGFIQRFELEARTLASLDHPHILPIYDFVVMPGVVFLTMPLVRGGTLRDILDRGPLDGATAWRYLREVGEGLQHAHDAGIIHRDLKPNNVLIHSDGRALLADFGLARSVHLDAHLTAVGFTLGTPGYMAPEQVLGRDLDHRCDIYAMGVMTFEMMTGHMPFAGANAGEIAVATVTTPVPSAAALNATLPDELDQVLARALAKDPAQRPSSVRELVALLGQVPQRRSTVTPAAKQPTVAAVSPSPPTPLSTPTSTPSTPRDPAPVTSPQPSRSSPTVAILEQMGVPRLHPQQTACVDWYFESVVHAARQVAGPAWTEVAGASGLGEFTDTDPPTGNNRTRPLTHLAALTSALESTYGASAPAKLGEWGRHTTERALMGRKSSPGEQRAIKLVPSKRRLTMLLKGHLESLDEVRGEPAHAWRQIDTDRVWTIHYQNPFALGRSRPDKACHFWIGSYEAMLRWAGLANDWLVEEIECGCVTGTSDCVFALRSVKT
jgi:serine/threonine protein kinase